MSSQSNCCRFPLLSILQSKPQAAAAIAGSPDYPQISGNVRFYHTRNGILVSAEIRGLPETDSSCSSRIFGFHIHKGEECSGNTEDAFSDALSHYNPHNCEHPYHAGDLPPLFGNHGLAVSVFLTDRFSISEIIGKVVIIHDSPDDFSTQPSGHSGSKIACGVIYQTSQC